MLKLILMQIQWNQALKPFQSIILNILKLIFGNAQISQKRECAKTKRYICQLIFIKIQLQQPCQSAKALVRQAFDLIAVKF